MYVTPDSTNGPELHYTCQPEEAPPGWNDFPEHLPYNPVRLRPELAPPRPDLTESIKKMRQAAGYPYDERYDGPGGPCYDPDNPRKPEPVEGPAPQPVS